MNRRRWYMLRLQGASTLSLAPVPFAGGAASFGQAIYTMTVEIEGIGPGVEHSGKALELIADSRSQVPRSRCCAVSTPTNLCPCRRDG